MRVLGLLAFLRRPIESNVVKKLQDRVSARLDD